MIATGGERGHLLPITGKKTLRGGRSGFIPPIFVRAAMVTSRLGRFPSFLDLCNRLHLAFSFSEMLSAWIRLLSEGGVQLKKATSVGWSVNLSKMASILMTIARVMRSIHPPPFSATPPPFMSVGSQEIAVK